MFTLTCPDCKTDLHHEKEDMVRRMLSRHRWFMHKIKSGSMLKREEAAQRRGMPVAPDINPATGQPYKSTPRQRASALARHRRVEAMARAAAKPEVQAHYEEIERGNLQSTSWWQTEKNKSITCPCCKAEFVIISGSK